MPKSLLHQFVFMYSFIFQTRESFECTREQAERLMSKMLETRGTVSTSCSLLDSGFLITAWSLPLCLKSCFSGHSNSGTYLLRPLSKSSKTDITREVVLAQWFTFTKIWMKGKVSEKWSYLLSGSLTLQYEWRERFQRSGPTCSVVHLHW